MVADVPAPLAIPPLTTVMITRRARLLASLVDLLSALPPLVIAALLATAWLLLRTSAGREDARGIDTAIALAIVGAVPPLWLARLAIGLVTRGATPGQYARGLRVTTTRAPTTSALLRLALHPFGAIGWGWIAAVLALAHMYEAAALFAGPALLVGLGGLASLVMILVDPDARALHDRVAGTRVVRA